MPLIKEISEEREIRDFDQRIRKILGPDSSPEYTVEPRACGIPVLLFYESGCLSRAITQGDFHGGEEITPNIKTMLSVPLNITDVLGDEMPPDHLEVRGTVYMEKAAMRQAPALAALKDEVVASLIRTDLRITAKRPLNIFCYGAERESDLGLAVRTHYDLMVVLQEWGFRVNRPHITKCPDLSSLIRSLRAIEEQRGQFPFGVDGAVVQVDPMKQRAAISDVEAGSEPIVIYAFES